MKRYNHYIFDLYATLLDIRTDQRKRMLWRHMAELYGTYGADWKPAQMQKAYQRICKEEEQLLSSINGSRWPEITLERVFVRLLLEAPQRHPSIRTIEGRTVQEWRESVYAGASAEMSAGETGKPVGGGAAAVPEQLVRSDWTACTASQFRLFSMCRLCLYPGTAETLHALRKQGCGVHLLSNAQRCFTVQEMETFGLWECFDSIFLSSDAGIRKPDPLFLEALLKQEKLDPRDCVMIGNEMETDMKIAAVCGVDAVFLNTGKFLPGEVQRQKEAAGLTGMEIPVLKDIWELLEEE